jgi:uncharacterized membrane protein
MLFVLSLLISILLFVGNKVLNKIIKEKKINNNYLNVIQIAMNTVIISIILLMNPMKNIESALGDYANYNFVKGDAPF